MIPHARKCLFFSREGAQIGSIMRVAEQIGGPEDGEIFVYLLLKNGKITKSPIQLVQELL